MIWESKNKNFRKNKRPISKKTIDIDKIVVFNNVSLGKKGFKYFTGYKDAKQITSLCSFSQRWVHIEETLMKLIICLF